MKTEARQSTSREDSVSGLKYVDRLQTFKCQAFQKSGGPKNTKMFDFTKHCGTKNVTLRDFTCFYNRLYNYQNKLYEESKCAIYLRITSGIRD